MNVKFRALFLLLALLVLSSSGPGVLAQPAGSADGFAHPEWLASTAWLEEHLTEANVAVVALTPVEQFTEGHIPGAAQIDWPALEIVETDEASIANWQPEVEAILTQLGIERDDTVVVYDGGTFIAARLWWILKQLGHPDVRVLNGGLEAWIADERAIETGGSTVEAASTPYAGVPDPAMLVRIDQAEAAFESGDAIFLDARRPDDEFAVGHIPGAINIPFIANAMSEGPKFWKSAEELTAMYTEAGLTPDDRIIVYCASGVRASVAYFALQQLGYENVAVFTGSYAEWSADPNRPVDTVTS